MTKVSCKPRFQLLCFLTLLLPVCTYSQWTQAKIEDLLTTGNKQWKLTGIMDPLSPACKGEYLRFQLLNHRVIRKTCNPETKKTDTVSYPWSVHSGRKYTWQLKISDTIYSLVINETAHKIALKLSTEGPGIHDVVINRYYEYLKPEY